MEEVGCVLTVMKGINAVEMDCPIPEIVVSCEEVSVSAPVPQAGELSFQAAGAKRVVCRIRLGGGGRGVCVCVCV